MKKLLLPLLAALCLFASCTISVRFDVDPAPSYKNSFLYDSGSVEFDIEDYPVESIEIEWVRGSVTIAYHDEDTIYVTEKANHSLKSDWKVHHYYNVKNESLKIKFCESGEYIDSDIRKDLTVYLPRGYKLPLLDIDTASAGVLANEIYCDTVDIDSASGDVELYLLGTTQFMELDGASADILVRAAYVKHFETDMAAGDFTFISTYEAPDKFEIDVAAGNIDITIPDNPGFLLDYSGVARSFNSTDFDLHMRRNLYRYGDCSREYEIDGAASTVTLRKYVDPYAE